MTFYLNIFFAGLLTILACTLVARNSKTIPIGIRACHILFAVLVFSLVGTRALPMEWTKNACPIFHGISADHAFAFTKYARVEYLTPLTNIRWTHGSGKSRELQLSSLPLSYDADVAADIAENIIVHLTIHVNKSGPAVTAALENVVISEELDPEYVFRLITSHLLSEFPDVSEIKFYVKSVPDYGIFRGQVATGKSAYMAFRSLSCTKAFEAFGFKIDRRQSKFNVLDPEGDESYYQGNIDPLLVVSKSKQIPASN